MMLTAQNRRVAPLSLRHAGFAAGFVLLAGTGFAQAQTVAVQGNSRVDSETIRSYVQGRSPEQAKQDLMATGLFSDVKVGGSGNTRVVHVQENEVVNRVVFEGNKKLN